MAQRAALSPTEARYVLFCLDAGALGADLAAYLGVSAMAISRLRNNRRCIVPMTASEAETFAADRDGAVVEASTDARPDGWPLAWPWPPPTSYACGCAVPARFAAPEYLAAQVAELDRMHARELADEAGLDRIKWPRRPLPQSREEIAARHFDIYGAEFEHGIDVPACHPLRMRPGR